MLNSGNYKGRNFDPNYHLRFKNNRRNRFQDGFQGRFQRDNQNRARGFDSSSVDNNCDVEEEEEEEEEPGEEEIDDDVHYDAAAVERLTAKIQNKKRNKKSGKNRHHNNNNNNNNNNNYYNNGGSNNSNYGKNNNYGKSGPQIQQDFLRAKRSLHNYHQPRTYDSQGDVYMCQCEAPRPGAEPTRCHSRLVVEHGEARRRARSLMHENVALRTILDQLCAEFPDKVNVRAAGLYAEGLRWLEDRRRDDESRYWQDVHDRR